ncbi:MAG: M20/M25/M40 family metallo-hydrolase [Salinivirgaceae bacterium]
MKKHLIILAAIAWSASTIAQTTISADSLSKHVYFLASDTLEGRSPGTKGCLMAANYIVKEFINLGIKPLEDDFFHHFMYRTGANSIEAKNILGVIEGSDPLLKYEYIILGAHYDHMGYYFDNQNKKQKVVFNGADDNASGVATIIEIARQLKQNNSLKRSIIIAAWDAEESGLKGSTQFVADSLINPSQIKLAYSIDMVGMLSKANGIDLLGLGTLKEGETSARQMADFYGIKLNKINDRVPSRTDTRPFGQIGIPVVHVTTGTLSPYHKPEDDAHLLDYDGMAVIASFLTDFVTKQANQSEPLLANLEPSAVQTNKEKKFRAGLRLNMGSNYDDYTNAFYQSKVSFAFAAGFYSQLRLNKRFTLQPEITYENKNAPSSLGNYNSQAITGDLNCLITTNSVPNQDVRGYLLLGGYYSKIFAGKIESDLWSFNDLFANELWGINWGLGMDIKFIQIGFTQKIGASILNKNELLPDRTNITSYFTIGYTF